MSDIFISYARATEARAHAIAEALRALGYNVWRDDELPAHRAYAEVIQERLAAAQAVVVVWSADAARSEWVQSEADRARADRKLVQLTIDGAPLPMPFDRVQCADLATWTGQADHPGWRKVVASLADLISGQTLAPTPAPSQAQAPAPTEPLLAVLAFDNLSGDPEMAYFSDGVSEEIQETVARGADLKVIGRSSSFQLRGADKAVRRVVAELGATHILDGSVRRAGDRVRITTQLIECAGGTTLWSNRFDRDLTDIFALQDEIAGEVAQALKTTFSPAAPALPIPPDIYDLYLQARALYVEVGASTGNRRERTLGMLETVVASAPAFAKAWADLAMVSAGLLRFADRAKYPSVSRQSVRHAAQTAIRLDPGSGPAYLALSLLEPFGHYQARADLHGKALAAIHDMATLGNSSLLFTELGRLRKATELGRLSFTLNPQVPLAAYPYVFGLTATGEHQQARAICDDLMVRWPDNPSIAGLALSAAGLIRDWDWFDAVAAHVQAHAVTDPELTETIDELLAERELTPALAAETLAKARAGIARDGILDLDAIARLARLCTLDEVFALIDQAAFDFMLDPDGAPPGELRGIIFTHDNLPMIRDPRFVGLCAKLGLCRYWVDTGHWPDCADQVDYDFRAEAERLAQA